WRRVQSVRSADRHRRGRLFCPTFLAEQKSGSAAGTNTRLLPTAVSAAMLYPPCTRCNGALLCATVATATATATVATRNVKGSDPLPTQVTLRYTRCASTQGERGRKNTTARAKATATATATTTATATATVATRNVKSSDPLPTRVTLRYTRCASTQGERGRRNTTASAKATATATVAARARAMRRIPGRRAGRLAADLHSCFSPLLAGRPLHLA
ncbi:MAG: hypothetical protein JWM30_744, partial [Burkholderia sp.]|nr:hypothetical protein [Burkholderia sp.]